MITPIAHFAWAEVRRLAQDKQRLMLWLAPILASVLCLWVYADRIARELPVGFVDQDHSALSRSLERSFDAAPQIALRRMHDAAEINEALLRGEIRGAIVIANGLGESVREGRTGVVTVWRDGSMPVPANQIYAATSGVVSTESARQSVGRLMVAGIPYNQATEMVLPLRVDSRIPENSYLDYMRYMAPGLIASFLQLALMLAGGNLLPHGWRHSPDARREMLGRSLPWLLGLGGVFTLGLMWLVQHTGYALPAVPATIAVGGLLMAASLITGAAFSRVIPNIHKSAQMLLAFNAPAFLLSGYAFPEWAFPPILEALTRPLPFSLFVDAWLAISGGPQGKGLSGLLGLGCYVLIPLLILLAPRRLPLLAPHERPVHQFDTRRRTPWHELRSALTTPGLSLLFAIALPSYFAIYGSVYTHKEELKLPLAITGAQNSEVSRLLTRSLDAHRRLHVVPMDEPDANEAMRLGTVRGILHIPDDLDSRLRHSQTTGIPLEVHADRLLPAGDIQRAVGEVVQAQGAAINAGTFMRTGLSPMVAKERAIPIAIDDHPAFNPLETYGDYMLPFLGALILHQILLIASAYASAYRAPSITRWITYVLWFSAWMAIWMGFGLRVFDVPNEANWASVAALSFLGIGAAACLGMTLGTLLKHELSVLQLLAFTSYPFFFLSGSSWPHEMMPPFVQMLGDLIPLTPLCTGLNRAYRMGADFNQLRAELIHLGVLLAAYGFIAWLTRWLIVRRNTGRPTQTDLPKSGTSDASQLESVHFISRVSRPHRSP